MRFLAWGRLLRLSLAPTAAADALCGLTLASGGVLPPDSAVWSLVASSLCVYHGGLALNDWADREHDRTTRPDRPIPSGLVNSAGALELGLLLLLTGPVIAWTAAPAAGYWMAFVAVLAAVYDLGGRGAWSGPLLLALCRAGNFGVGFAFVGGRSALPLGLALGGAYAAYVFLASRLGRMEDGVDARPLGARPSRLLYAAAAALLAVPTFPAWIPGWGRPAGLPWLAAAGLVAWAVLGIVRIGRDADAWTRARVERAMGVLLRRLLIFTAAGCLLAPAIPAADASAALRSGWVIGLLILTGYPIAHALRRVFPPS